MGSRRRRMEAITSKIRMERLRYRVAITRATRVRAVTTSSPGHPVLVVMDTRSSSRTRNSSRMRNVRVRKRGTATRLRPAGTGNRGTLPQPGYPPQGPYAPQGGQTGGQLVTVAPGALLRVRINRGLDSNHLAIGTPFDGTVLSDVAADGQIAIPRGASVQGVVVDSKKAGVLKGGGELSLQIDNVMLGGVSYPVASDIWEREGGSKTARTVNSALGLGALGAIIGGVAGGGAGAAIGAGVGAGAGVAGSAASGGGRVIVPPEAVLSFHLAQPVTVKTVSEAEMQRLAYGAGPGQGGQPIVRRRYAPYPPQAGYPYPY